MTGKKGILHPWNKDKKGTFEKGHVQSDISKDKISKTRIEKKIGKGKNNSFYGEKHTPKTLFKMKKNHWSKNSEFRTKVIEILKLPVEQDIKDKISETLTTTGIGNYRKVALKKLKHSCVECGVTNLKILVVHHKDRNRYNNNLDNLEFLCRNCHFLEHLDEWRKSRK